MLHFFLLSLLSMQYTSAKLLSFKEAGKSLHPPRSCLGSCLPRLQLSAEEWAHSRRQIFLLTEKYHLVVSLGSWNFTVNEDRSQLKWGGLFLFCFPLNFLGLHYMGHLQGIPKCYAINSQFYKNIFSCQKHLMEMYQKHKHFLSSSKNTLVYELFNK